MPDYRAIEADLRVQGLIAWWWRWRAVLLSVGALLLGAMGYGIWALVMG